MRKIWWIESDYSNIQEAQWEKERWEQNDEHDVTKNKRGKLKKKMIKIIRRQI